jgi:hypothetical protein
LWTATVSSSSTASLMASMWMSTGSRAGAKGDEEYAQHDHRADGGSPCHFFLDAAA